MVIDIPISTSFLKVLQEDAAAQGLRLDSYLVSLLHTQYRMMDAIAGQMETSERPPQFHPLARGQWQPLEERLGAGKLRRVK